MGSTTFAAQEVRTEDFDALLAALQSDGPGDWSFPVSGVPAPIDRALAPGPPGLALHQPHVIRVKITQTSKACATPAPSTINSVTRRIMPRT